MLPECRGAVALREVCVCVRACMRERVHGSVGQPRQGLCVWEHTGLHGRRVPSVLRGPAAVVSLGPLWEPACRVTPISEHEQERPCVEKQNPS